MESTQPILRCRYSYDPLDRLISQLQPEAPAHQRFYCKSRLATEIQGAIGFSVFQNSDLLLAQHKNQGGSVKSTLLATDLQRSVLHAVTADQQQHPIAYSPYGHHQAESGLTSLLGFNGERPDAVTGHYLLGNGYRAFNPVLMRFNSPDSLSPFGKGGTNSYAYCLGDPINKYDSSGRFPGKRLAGALMSTSPAKRILKVSPAYKNGPDTIFETVKKTTTHTTKKQWVTMERDGEQWRTVTTPKYTKLNNNGEEWYTKTTSHNDQDKELYYKYASSDGDFINIQTAISGRNNYSFMRATPNLQELAYQKTPGQQLQSLYNNFSMPKIDIEFEKNLQITTQLNFHSEVIRTQTDARRAYWFNERRSQL
ncbi:RHS repeat-associated core domain-containing protein [Pseudomonas sp. NPDC087626]|uniref:RHS repeat-associated core domain-containing protein n=1 Tax=Pseudomonas sp. NPDC087626 TaxID=3364444 RepID=UPI0037F671B5